MHEVREAGKVLWRYHLLARPLPTSVDLMLVGGSHDRRVAQFAASIAERMPIRLIVISGGAGKITSKVFSKTEAEIFADVMEANGVDRKRLLLETQARHSGENIILTKELLDGLGEAVGTGLLVTKPYMERRFLATAEKQWPEIDWSVTSPPVSYEEYPTAETPEKRMLELMVGDFQRIKVYAERGIQTPQVMPLEAWNAFNVLVDAGYDAQLIR